MTKTAKILAVLTDGPATSGEISAETGIRSRDVGTLLRNNYQRGRLDRKAFRKTGVGRCDVWLGSIRAPGAGTEGSSHA